MIDANSYSKFTIAHELHSDSRHVSPLLLLPNANRVFKQDHLIANTGWGRRPGDGFDSDEQRKAFFASKGGRGGGGGGRRRRTPEERQAFTQAQNEVRQEQHARDRASDQTLTMPDGSTAIVGGAAPPPHAGPTYGPADFQQIRARQQYDIYMQQQRERTESEAALHRALAEHGIHTPTPRDYTDPTQSGYSWDQPIADRINRMNERDQAERARRVNSANQVLNQELSRRDQQAQLNAQLNASQSAQTQQPRSPTPHTLDDGTSLIASPAPTQPVAETAQAQTGAPAPAQSTTQEQATNQSAAANRAINKYLTSQTPEETEQATQEMEMAHAMDPTYMPLARVLAVALAEREQNQS